MEPGSYTQRPTQWLTPLYAILSHTWGVDKEEVTFADIVNSGSQRDQQGVLRVATPTGYGLHKPYVASG
jgi:hypothetical protein